MARKKLPKVTLYNPGLGERDFLFSTAEGLLKWGDKSGWVLRDQKYTYNEKDGIILNTKRKTKKPEESKDD